VATRNDERGISYKVLNSRMMDEAATEFLRSDAVGQGQQTYRRRFGIVWPEQIIKAQNREYLVPTIDHVMESDGMYWRTAPTGRKVRTEKQRANGSGFYQ
jgi:hypothetical protein